MCCTYDACQIILLVGIILLLTIFNPWIVRFASVNLHFVNSVVTPKPLVGGQMGNYTKFNIFFHGPNSSQYAKKFFSQLGWGLVVVDRSSFVYFGLLEQFLHDPTTWFMDQTF